MPKDHLTPRCIAGVCFSDVQRGKRAAIAPNQASGWQWSTDTVANASGVEMLQMIGGPDCCGAVQVLVQQAERPTESTGHLVALLQWSQGGGDFHAYFDVSPGQAVDLLGVDSMRLTVGWVGTVEQAKIAIAAATRTPRTTGKPHLTTPPLPIGETTLLVPPWAKSLLCPGEADWQVNGTSLGMTAADVDGSKPVPGTADSVVVTLAEAGTCVWELAL